ncbi:MAG TPA: ABC transporter permease [Propionibacteriaceae bacterium]|nr:ABC transporter permease [Propionibacteriaceae bacterium]
MTRVDRVLAIVVKEFRHLLRDPRVLATVLLLPIAQLLLFAYAISFDVHNVPTMVVDQDRTPASRAYLNAYSAGGFFQVVGEASGIDDVDGIFKRGEASVVVIVPAGFEQALSAGERADVDVLVDGSDPNGARMGQAYALALNRVYGQQVAATWAEKQGLDLSAAGGLEPRVRTWFNPDRQSSIFLIPGLVAVILMIVCVQQTAVTVVRERDLHTAEQMVVSPVSHTELIIGKLLPWTILAFFDMALVVVVGMWVFGLPLRGSVVLLLVASLLFVFASLAMGVIVSTIAPSMETANVMALMLAFLPGLLLSGLAFPLESIPVVLQWVASVFPARYMVDISRGVFLKGNGFADEWRPLASLALYTVVALVVAVRLYARKVRT